MRAVIFACVLFVAGASAMPQDVAPIQPYIVDMVIQDIVESIRNFILRNELDPLVVQNHHFDTTLIPGLLYLKGFVKDTVVQGGSDIFLNSVSYNILLGRLDVDLVMPKISMSFGEYQVEGRYGDRGGVGRAAGSIVINNLRLISDALLVIRIGLPVYIHNINARLSLGGIEADVTASWKCLGCLELRDVSSCANNILNVRIGEILEDYAPQIGTGIAELIRHIVHNIWRP